jgi:hypothetical protein
MKQAAPESKNAVQPPARKRQGSTKVSSSAQTIVSEALDRSVGEDDVDSEGKSPSPRASSP